MSRNVGILFNALLTDKRRSSRIGGESSPKRRSRRQKAPKSRKSILEQLEERALLSVSPTEYAEIREAYPALNLPETADALNVIEIEATNLTVTSLKAAIAQAGTTKNDDLIVLRTTDSTNKITYASDDDEIKIEIDSSKYGALNVVAFGTQPLTIDAAQKSRVLSISKGAIRLANLTITGGKTTSDGGGVYVYDGRFTATNSTISGNSSKSSGGGVYVYYGTFTATNSTISGNSAEDYGGGVYVDDGRFTATNSTISGNSAEYYGGGVYVCNGTFTATNSTISGNSATFDGGGVYVGYGTFTATNVIVTMNYGSNVSGTISSESANNLIGYNLSL